MTFDPTTRRLTPAEGLWLTQKEITDGAKRGFSRLMYLGINDSPDNYTEWTQEQWEEEHKPVDSEQDPNNISKDWR